MGEVAAAQAAFGQVMEQAPRSYSGILAGRQLKTVGVSSAKAVSVSLPQFPAPLLEQDLHFLKARELYALGFADDALAEFDLVRDWAGEDHDRLYALALVYHDIQEPGRALRLLRHYFTRLAQAPPPSLPATFWRALYPSGYVAEVQAEASRNGLDSAFVAAVIREESSYDPSIVSPVGARGLMQLMPDTARLVARELGEAYDQDPATLHDVRLNIRLGTRYLATLMQQFGEPALVAAGYNAGPHRVVRWWAARRNGDLEEWIEAIPFDETRGFVKRVLTSLEEYRRLSAKTDCPSC
jgi:soluble lytic murein transglycosylase